MANLSAIKAEIDSDPLARGYSGMTDAQVAADLNTVYRPAPGVAIEEIREYLVLEKKAGMSLLGRIQVVAESSVGSDPLGEALSGTLEHITAAKAIMASIAVGAERIVDVSDPRFDSILSDIAGGSGAKAINPAHRTALVALADNRQSRATELGLGRVREGSVAQARALP